MHGCVWGGGGGPEMLPLSWQLAVSIDFSPLTKIHQAALLAHRFCFSVVVGGGSNTLRIYTAIIFSAECKQRSAPRSAPLRYTRHSLGFTGLAQH